VNRDKSPFVVTGDWVEKNLGAPEFRVVDASWYLPAQGRNGAAEYSEGHIPGAVFFDQDAVADHTSGLPHTIPSPEYFASEVGKLGISDTDTIVVYDGPGNMAAPRAWWLFRLMGARRVYVLDGGLDGWKSEERPLETDLPEPKPGLFRAAFDRSMVTSLTDMKEIVAKGSRQIADARSAGRFAGTDPEPRAGLRSGHMPGAKSLPSGGFFENGKLKPRPALRKLFEEAGIDLGRPVVTSCGSGVTAAIITLALASLGHSDNTLYDGSWSEWGGLDESAPVVTGNT
jgi:thiosulfate/3-mercaptopyruvate sulfurtransferase